MFDMLVVQSNGGLTPLTPVSTSPAGHHHLPTDLSPRSVHSTSSSLMSDSPNSSSPTPIKDFHSHLHHHQQLFQDGGGSSEDYSALQRLQYALQRDALFSNLIQNGSMSPNQNVHLMKRDELESEPDNSKPMIENLNASLEDSEPRSTDSSSNLIETPTGSPSTTLANIFQCPLCSIICNGRHSFNEHLVTHTQQHFCPKCNYFTSKEENLRDHLQESHDLTDPEGLTDDEVRVPKMNSQGKVKTFKCKQCQHIAITKMEFWAHSKSHIRQEKMLTCPKCPFVTEYKHHLEYHLRNHFGSKPFQCTECSYSCVNKSMLNSHLKSHSTVYQYRCADCSYATKYCHSLKLHLRKYSHNPSAVLNPDGSHNPLTIIDVYGTRRGPKIKRPAPGTELPAKIIQSLPSPDSNDGCDEDGKGDDYDQLSQASPNTRNENTDIKQTLKRFTSDTSDSMSDNEMRHQTGETPLPEVNRINFSTFQNHVGDPKIILEQMAAKSPLEFYAAAAAINQYLYANPILRMQPVQDLTKIVTKDQQDQLLSQVYAVAQTQSHKREPSVSPIHSPLQMQANQSPLDLRQPHPSVKSGNGNVKSKVEWCEIRSQGQCSEDLKKRKRKGKAKRYEREIAENLHQPLDEDQVLDFSNNNNHLRAEKKDIILICKYCEISFLDQVLYSMHMNYHSGDSDPFLCRSCGKKTPNKIAFSMHLTTDPH